jgi:hypothetical protein
MTYEHYFAAHLEQLKAEGRYRTFMLIWSASAANSPKPFGAKPPKTAASWSPSGAVMIIWAWASIRR